MKAVFRPLALFLLPLFVLALSAFGGAGAARAADSYPIDQTMGKADAPVTIVEYASLTCPHCAHFEENTLPKVKAEWIDTGKAKLIFRDFPTGPVGPSLAASMVAHCAGPERYFGVLDLLFRTQEKWIDARSPVEEIKRIVAVAGIRPEQVEACLQRQDLLNAIQARADAANKTYNIDSTPTLMINGQIYPGALSYDDLKPKLEDAYRAATGK